MQNASLLRHVLSAADCPVVPQPSTLSPKPYDFRKKMTEHKKWVSFFSATYDRIFFSFYEKFSAVVPHTHTKFSAVVPHTHTKFSAVVPHTHTKFSAVVPHTHTGLRAKCPFFCQILIKTWIFSTDCRNILKYRTYGTPSSRIKAVLCGWVDRQTWRS